MGFFAFIFSAFQLGLTPLTNSRTLFTKLDKGEQYVDSIIKITEKYSTSPVMLAYNGAGHTAKAKYIGNVFTKYSQAKKGISIVNKAALKGPKSVEVRFVRYCIETNIPPVMPFDSHIKADRLFIINNLSKSHQHFKAIKAFMFKYADLTEVEKKKLNS